MSIQLNALMTILAYLQLEGKITGRFFQSFSMHFLALIADTISMRAPVAFAHLVQDVGSSSTPARQTEFGTGNGKIMHDQLARFFFLRLPAFSSISILFLIFT